MYIKKRNYFLFIMHQVNKHGVSWRWFTKADVKDFKSGALIATTNITRTGFKLRVSQSQNAICFSMIMIPQMSHFTILAIENLVQYPKRHMDSIYIFGIIFVR